MSHVYQWKHDNNVSIWYAEMRNRITDIKGKRLSLGITSILPVIKDNNAQIIIPFSEQDKKLTLSNVKRYLETASN